MARSKLVNVSGEGICAQNGVSAGSVSSNVISTMGADTSPSSEAVVDPRCPSLPRLKVDNLLEYDEFSLVGSRQLPHPV